MLEICRSVDAKIVTKGKSMIAEEVGLNEHLEENGITPVETDLGEYIIQLRHEPPSHLIAPAIHLMKEQVAETFRAEHRALDPRRSLAEARQLCDEARAVLRPQFLAADVGITGANFLVAETGSSIIVTNEGNGDLTQTLPRVHIVMTSLEKLVPTLEDAATLLRLLARSATGQEFSSYTTVSTGPRRPGDLDGPEQYHVVLLDNGRSALLGSEFQDMLRCIRCSACMNHCPVYAAVGGHAYGWVYSGPMGAVLTPSLIGIARSRPPAERLDLLRAVRGGVPGQDPAAEDDAALAGAGICREAEPAGLPGRPVPVGLGGAPAGPLPCARRARQPRARVARARPRAVSLPAVGRRLDRGARHAGAGGPQLPQPVGRAAKSAVRRDERGTRGDPRRHPALAQTRPARRRRAKRSCGRGLRRIGATWSPRGRRHSTHRGRVDLFVAMAEEVQATVARVDSLAAVPEAVAGYLAAENLPAELVVAPDRSLDDIPWDARPLLRIRRGRAEPDDAVSLTPCFAAIAETGTLMLISGADTPTTLNFLPDTHIVVVRGDQIVATYEDGWDRLRVGRWAAAGDQFHYRSVADGRHRAAHRARRPRAPTPSCHSRRRPAGMSNVEDE